MWRVVLALALGMGSAAAQAPPVAPVAMPRPGPVSAPNGPDREQMHWIARGDTVLSARLCRPPGNGPVPLALLNHGEPPPARRGSPGGIEIHCWSNEARFFLRRGYAVLAPARSGYRPSWGRRPATPAPCIEANGVALAQADAADLAAALVYGLALPDIRRDGAVAAGWGSGGWAVLGLLADPPAGLAGAVVSQPGLGGRRGLMAACDPGALREAAQVLGARARTPLLWLAAASDERIPLPEAIALHAAYAAGGAPAELVRLAGVNWDQYPAAHQLWNGINDLPVPAGEAAGRFLDGLQ